MEEWIRWEPIDGLSGQYSLDSFAWSEKGFNVELINHKNKEKIEILFDGYIDGFRYTYESFYLELPRDFYGEWKLFKSTNSEYLKWLSEKSCTLSDQMDFIHFCIVGGDEVIDIVANYEPKVRFIEYKPKVKIIE